jgi:hypothetical protein
VRKRGNKEVEVEVEAVMKQETGQLTTTYYVLIWLSQIDNQPIETTDASSETNYRPDVSIKSKHLSNHPPSTIHHPPSTMLSSYQ